MNIKLDDKLAIWVTRGLIVEIQGPGNYGAHYRSVCGHGFVVGKHSELPAWPVRIRGTPQQHYLHPGYSFLELSVCDVSLRPIRDQPGNEHWVTEARKTIPRPIPVTGPVTINHRGEPA